MCETRGGELVSITGELIAPTQWAERTTAECMFQANLRRNSMGPGMKNDRAIVTKTFGGCLDQAKSNPRTVDSGHLPRLGKDLSALLFACEAHIFWDITKSCMRVFD